MRRSNARRTASPDSNQNVDVLKRDLRMDSVKLQYRLNHRSRPSRTQNQKSNLVFYIVVSCFAIILCYLFLFSKSNIRSSNFVKYGIVIDGGSTGTRIHVFKYKVVDENGKRKVAVFDFSEGARVSMKLNPGLSAYEKEPERAGRSVEELVKFGRRKVPSEYWEETEIRLMATAGMRLLDKDAQERILSACRSVLRSSGFKFRDDWATVISGSDEGLFAWVIANYAIGTLGGDPLQTTGIIELGGASAQVTFVSAEPMPPETTRRITFGNFSYNLYSHSLLHFGQNVAFDVLRDSLISSNQELATESLQRGKLMDPCTPRGYTHDRESGKLSPSSLTEKSRYLSSLLPSGNFSECRSASFMMLQKDKNKCTYQSCSIGSTFIPKLQGKFLATENFFHTSKFFGLAQKAFLGDLIVAGQQFCEEDWSKLRSKYQSLEEEDLLRYCFSSAYIVAFLHDSLGISLDDERIGYANQVEGIPLDWALGAFILKTTQELDSDHSTPIETVIHGGDLSTLAVLFGVSVVLVFVAWTVSKWRKPQLKTIYDLEKGKYIITRVNRCS